jgi:tRNA dimethylallyltransferase
MFENGFMDEVKALLAKGYSEDLPTMSAIGYRECIRVVRGQLTEEQAKVEMKRATRIFVRRQANWFKESDKNMKWFEMSPSVEDEVRHIILKWMKPEDESDSV